MGQQNGKVARATAARVRLICAMQTILLIKRRLVQLARLLRSVRLDAAMHIRKGGTPANWIRFWIEPAQHRPDAIDVRMRSGFETLCSLKTK